MTYRFLDCELDSEVFSLRRRGRFIAVEPRVFDLLLYLIERRDRMVSQDELLEHVWRGHAVVRSALGRAVCMARKALGRPDVIRTIHCRGYQWAAATSEATSAQALELAETFPQRATGKHANSQEQP